MEWKDRALDLRKRGRQWKQMYDILLAEYPEDDFSYEQMRSHVRRYSAAEKNDATKKRDAKTGIVGVIADLHVPFNHPNYLPFLVDTFKRYGVETVVSIGDLVDHHAMSRFQSETCALGAVDELEVSKVTLKKYSQAFPTVQVCAGNHDLIPVRQAATVNIDERYLKSLFEVLELPKTWTLEEEFVIDDVLYKHGINCLGKDGAINAAIQERMSTVIGHSHSFGGCKYSANKRNIIFGLNVGCGIDINAYAFAYGKHAKFRPTIGCGIVFDSSFAIFVPMPEKYFRD